MNALITSIAALNAATIDTDSVMRANCKPHIINALATKLMAACRDTQTLAATVVGCTAETYDSYRQAIAAAKATLVATVTYKRIQRVTEYQVSIVGSGRVVGTYQTERRARLAAGKMAHAAGVRGEMVDLVVTELPMA